MSKPTKRQKKTLQKLLIRMKRWIIEWRRAEEQKSEETAKMEEQVSKKREEKSEVKGGKRSEKKMKRRKSSRGREEYKIYVYRVLKQVHPGVGVSSKAMTALNNLMKDMLRGWLMRRRGWLSIRPERRCRRGKFRGRWGWFFLVSLGGCHGRGG